MRFDAVSIVKKNPLKDYVSFTRLYSKKYHDFPTILDFA